MNDIRVIDMRIQPGDSGFLIDDSETAILCDSGFGFTGFALADKIRNYLGGRPLDYIFSDTFALRPRAGQCLCSRILS